MTVQPKDKTLATYDEVAEIMSRMPGDECVAYTITFPSQSVLIAFDDGDCREFVGPDPGLAISNPTGPEVQNADIPGVSRDLSIRSRAAGNPILETYLGTDWLSGWARIHGYE